MELDHEPKGQHQGLSKIRSFRYLGLLSHSSHMARVKRSQARYAIKSTGLHQVSPPAGHKACKRTTNCHLCLALMTEREIYGRANGKACMSRHQKDRRRRGVEAKTKAV